MNDRLLRFSLMVAATFAVFGPSPCDAQEPSARGRFRTEIRGGYLAVDKNGVPDFLRAGGSAGVMALEFGPLALSVDAVFVFGHAERAGWSMRAGGNVEGEWLWAAIQTSTYLSTGLHYFESHSEEDRTGLLWRSGAGLRFMPGGRWYVAFEPLAVERLPDGPGLHTPLRSRWGFDFTFLAVGYRP